jgi:glycosyltransferase involved in cell wall biosynthesis
MAQAIGEPAGTDKIGRKLIPFPLRVFLGMPYNGKGPSYTCAEIMKSMSSPDLDISLITPRLSKPTIADDIKVIEALPRWARWPFPYKFVQKLARPHMEAIVWNSLKTGEWQRGAAFIWGGMSVPLARALRRRGIVTFREATNCHLATAKRILDDAYRRVRLPPNHTINEAMIKWENEFLAEMDFIFCPNAKVMESMLENNIPEGKLLSASYGWSPSRLEPSRVRVPRNESLTLAFVGSISIRKGAHLLMEYWARSGVKGRLVLAGEIESSVLDLCRDFIARGDIALPGYVKDIGSIYKAADVFVFPSLEEGGPQVTYEAAGCGLPVITTPMGAGRIIEHGINGYVIDPYDADAWIGAFRMLAASAGLRQQLSNSARESANRFTWSEVGKRRRTEVISAGSRLDGTFARGQ